MLFVPFFFGLGLGDSHVETLWLLVYALRPKARTEEAIISHVLRVIYFISCITHDIYHITYSVLYSNNLYIHIFLYIRTNI